MKKKVLILCFTDTNHDIRVARQVDFLKDTYDLTFAGYGTHCPHDITFLALRKIPTTFFRKWTVVALLLARWYRIAYWIQYPYQSLKQRTDRESFDIILANDIETLPLAFYLEQKRAKMVYDAHEYAPRHFEDRFYWRVLFRGFNVYFCRTFIPRVDQMFTVCDGLAREYQRDFGVLPRVLTNAASFHDLEPSPVAPDRIRLIHHGNANPSRKLENMVKMMRYVDERFTLDLMLRVNSTSSRKFRAYFQRLQSLVEATPNVRILPPIPSQQVVSFIHQYDMGVFILEPVNFNYAHALPNKLFDFVQARLAVGISPSVEMKKVVEEYALGVVAVDYSPRALADQLNRLTTDEVAECKQRSHRAARRLSADHNRKLLQETLRGLLE